MCMSAVSAGISEVLIKYTGKYVNIYFIMKITFAFKLPPVSILLFLPTIDLQFVPTEYLPSE